MGHQSRDVPAGNIPDIGGRKLTGSICPAEIVDQEMMGSVVGVANSFIFLRQSGNRLNGTYTGKPCTFGNVLDRSFIVTADTLIDFRRLQLLGKSSLCKRNILCRTKQQSICPRRQHTGSTFSFGRIPKPLSLTLIFHRKTVICATLWELHLRKTSIRALYLPIPCRSSSARPSSSLCPRENGC